MSEEAHNEVLDLLTKAWLRSIDSGDYYLIGEDLERLILKLRPPYLPCMRCGRRMSWLKYHIRQGVCMECAEEMSKEADD
ncbi:MAG: hypothetical protein DRP01_01085 [Archaeoglobales archaeon]|nr:MAG: hypothetical protein DRP01_01085 [Archaeoglobales archaeon]